MLTTFDINLAISSIYDKETNTNDKQRKKINTERLRKEIVLTEKTIKEGFFINSIL